MSKDDYIEVDWYLCGVYQGKRKVGKSSIAGRLLSGDFLEAFRNADEMKRDLEKIGCIVEVQPTDVMKVSSSRTLKSIKTG